MCELMMSFSLSFDVVASDMEGLIHRSHHCRRRIRNIIKQLDEIRRDRDPQVVSMIATMLEPIQYIHYLFVCYAGGILFLRLQQIRGGRRKQIGDGDGDGDEVVDEREGGV